MRAPARAPRAVRAALATAYASAIAAVDPERVARAALRRERARLVVRASRRARGVAARARDRGGGRGQGERRSRRRRRSRARARRRRRRGRGPAGLRARAQRASRCVHGGHPLPDRRSVAAVGRVLAVLARHPRAAVLVVLSGGASSLLAAPAPGLTLGDLQRTSTWLLASGIDIGGTNVVRKHLSAIGGGRLAAHLVGRAAVAIVVSDVPSDDLAVIGSGPTVADPTTYADALADRRHGGTSERAAGAGSAPSRTRGARAAWARPRNPGRRRPARVRRSSSRATPPRGAVRRRGRRRGALPRWSCGAHRSPATRSRSHPSLRARSVGCGPRSVGPCRRS